MTHVASNRSIFVGVDNLSYYKTLSIQHLKPFIIQQIQFTYVPLPLILNTDKFINSDYNIKCHISQGATENLFSIRTLKSDEIQPGILLNSQFGCDFLTNFGDSTHYEVAISAEIETQRIMLTNISAIIHIIGEMDLPVTNGFSSGGTLFQIQLPIQNATIFPTTIYNDYSFALTVEDTEGNKVTGKNCSIEGKSLNCTVPSINDLYKSDNFSRFIEMSLSINSQKAIQFIPNYHFHSKVIITEYN